MNADIATRRLLRFLLEPLRTRKPIRNFSTIFLVVGDYDPAKEIEYALKVYQNTFCPCLFVIDESESFQGDDALFVREVSKSLQRRVSELSWSGKSGRITPCRCDGGFVDAIKTIREIFTNSKHDPKDILIISHPLKLWRLMVTARNCYPEVRVTGALRPASEGSSLAGDLLKDIMTPPIVREELVLIGKLIWERKIDAALPAEIMQLLVWNSKESNESKP